MTGKFFDKFRQFWPLIIAFTAGITLSIAVAAVASSSFLPFAAFLLLVLATGLVCWFVYASTGKNRQLRQQRSQLDKVHDELLRRNEDLEQFAYMASHDLQTPVRHILSRATMLRDDIADADYTEAAYNSRVIIDASRRMQNFILDLLDYCRAGAETISVQRVDVAALVDREMSVIRDAETPLGMCINAGDLPVIETDEIKLSQVFQNLLTNAIKFRRKDTPLIIDIDATLDEERQQWSFCVRDNGIGIASEQHERIFLPFKQLDAADRQSSSGMGLSIAQKVVERLGGQIRVESRPGEGAAFHFTLPAVYTGPDGRAVADQP